MGRIARVVKIVPLQRDKNEVMTEYLAGCLALSPDERIDEMRRLSRRIISLNPQNPRSPRMERNILKITHDAV
jgi:hypothetical protein